jgi:hypothetical protein
MDQRMGINSLKGTLTNPQRVYLWDVLIPDPVGGGNTETLMLRCQSTAIPGESVGQIVIPYKQTPGAAYPGKRTVSHTWTCTFIEGEDQAIIDNLRPWLMACVNNDGVGEGDDVIKRDVYLKMLSTKGDDTREVKLVGAFLQDIAEVALSYDAEEVVRYSITFSFDDVESVA